LEIELEGGCTWIYQKNDSSTNGICVAKSTTNSYSCEDLNRTNQCIDGANIISLSDECRLYPDRDSIDSGGDGDGDSNGRNSCKKHCIKLEDINSCKERTNDCFWLDKNDTVTKEDPPGNPVEERCVNKVCICIYMYILFY
jgi:hypothetical protein